jgi:hypothetical protein
MVLVLVLPLWIRYAVDNSVFLLCSAALMLVLALLLICESGGYRRLFLLLW